jgi:hypothetical protein
LDEDGELLVEEDKDERFKIARAGDHFLMIPFQCELCHFTNSWDETLTKTNKLT